MVGRRFSTITTISKINVIRGVSVFGGVGERTREGNDLYEEMKESGVINEKNFEESKVALVYGQMNEPPGARMRVGLTGWPSRNMGRSSVNSTRWASIHTSTMRTWWSVKCAPMPKPCPWLERSTRCISMVQDRALRSCVMVN